MTSYSLIGQAALAGTYVPIPFLVRSIGQSMLIGDGAQRLHISANMLEYLESDVDPANPTRMFDKYEFDWWNGPETVDDRSGEELEKAYYFHVDKVILNFPDIVWGSSLSSTGSKYTRLQISRACHSFRYSRPEMFVPPRLVEPFFSPRWTKLHRFSEYWTISVKGTRRGRYKQNFVWML